MHDQREEPERGRSINGGAQCLPCLLHSRINPEQGGQAKRRVVGRKKRRVFMVEVERETRKKVEMGVTKPKKPSP